MKIGINGSGLITRAIIKLINTIDEFKEIQIGQINGRTMDIETLKDRLLFSSAHGHSNLDIKVDKDNNSIIINGQKVIYTQTSSPEEIPWLDNIHLVIEATGKFNDKSKFEKDPNKHFKSPKNRLKVVLISAPGKGGIENFMWFASPNLEQRLKAMIEKNEPFVIGGASCTTTAAIPIIDTLDQAFGIESCFLTTIHAVTRSQDILDGSKGWSAFNTNLHTTGATKVTNNVLRKDIPMDGIAYRTSEKAGCYIQIDSLLKKKVTKEEVITAFKNSKYTPYISYAQVKSPPSSYVLGNLDMVVIIPEEISIINEKRVIVKGLYDNEEGYAAHLLRLIKYLLSILHD